MHTQISRKFFLKTVADRIPVGLLYLNKDQECVAANEVWKTLTGLSDDELIGKGWLKSIHPNNTDELIKRLSETGCDADEVELQIVRADGIVNRIHLHISFPSAGSSDLLGYLLTVTKLSDNNSLPEEDERYKELVNQATDMIYEVTTTGKFSFANPITAKVLKYPLNEIIGKRYFDIVHYSQTKYVDRFYKKQITEKIQQTYLEFIAVAKDGKEVWLGQNITLIFKNGEVAGIHGVARDITRQKLSERSGVAQSATVKILAESETIDDAIVSISNKLTEIIGWNIGACWRFNENLNVLQCKTVTMPKTVKNSEAFIQKTKDLNFKSGEGIVGKVWKNKKALWLSGVTKETRFLRAESAKKAGLNSAFWFPILLSNSVYGVFEFLHQDIYEKDDDLLQLLSNIGSQIGQFIERKYAEREAESSKLRKLAILESSMDCIVTINHEGRVLEFNSAAEKTFGYSREEAVGKLMGDLIVPPKYREAHRKGIQTYLVTGKQNVLGRRIEIVGMRKDGTEFPVELAITPILLPGTMPVFTGYLRDITDRKIAESELYKAKEDAQSASIAKSQFLAVMSHEIRTPLNAIIGLGELAAESDSDQERIGFLQTIQENSETLLSLISEVLDFSKIEAGQIEIEQIEFNVTETVENVLDLLAFKAFAKGLELILQIDKNLPETIIGDSTRLRQILINLIGNAIKFTESGEVFVSLKAEVSTLQTVRILFAVKDTGIGITDDKKTIIFDRFNQADISTTRKYGGTGLGLSICKSLVNLMNGEIGVRNNLEQGSEFYFSIDFAVGKLAKPFEFADKLSSLNILVVEGNKSAKAALTEIFSAYNPNLLFVANASESIKAIEKHNFDIAVIENDLPMIEGQSLAQLVKINSSNLIKIILLSNNIHQNTESVLIDKYVSKPIKKADLLNAIAEISDWTKTDSADARKSDENQPETVAGRILLAEDNKPNQILACRIIEKAGYEIDVASNGAEAVEMFLGGKYDLILMDIEMPEMDGFQATAQIRNSETNTNIPIIALTAHAIEGYREKCLSFGMNDYITKPLRREHLLKTVRHFLAKKISDSTLPEEPEIVAYIDEDIMDLVPDYLESCRRSVLLLKDFIDTNNFKSIQKIGHDLKGSGRGYGFENITLAGSLIEANAKIMNINEIIKAVAEMEIYIGKVKVVLK